MTDSGAANATSTMCSGKRGATSFSGSNQIAASNRTPPYAQRDRTIIGSSR